MLPNTFSVAGRAAQLPQHALNFCLKIAAKVSFEGFPAFNAAYEHFNEIKNYILHTGCIDRVASSGIGVYNFGMRRRAVHVGVLGSF